MEAEVLVSPKRERMGILAWLRIQSSSFLIATAVLIIHLLVALTGPLWAPYPYDKTVVGRPYGPPSSEHLLGTDHLGRDVFSRVVYGEGIVLSMALSATGIAVLLGPVLGLLMAYIGGWVDELVMRIMEIIICFPTLIIALLILGTFGSGRLLIVLVIAFLYIPRMMSVVRGAALDVITEDFVTAARLRGESALSVAIRELLPNVLATVLVEFSLRTGYAVLFVGGLGFLGFGVNPPTPEWGVMINEGREYVFSAPWPALGPTLAIGSLVVALSFFTEGLNDLLGLSVQEGR
jgi:peptide/nickel transport system permease protein